VSGSFRKDLYRGQEGEREVEKLLRSLGCRRNDGRKKADLAGWDYEFQLGGARKCEVKRDAMEAKTSNLALEYFNPKSNRPSGLNATAAEVWFVVLDNPRTVWGAAVATLKRYVKENKPARTIERGGDDNASLWLYPSPLILRACFRDFTGAGPDKVAKLLRDLLGSR
jgi:hypothetical protein